MQSAQPDLSFLHDLADAAEAHTLPRFRQAVEVADKSGGGRFDPVTAADRDAEAAMRALIAARFPGHGVLGEEFGAQAAGGSQVWVLDPIDGTRAFVSGLPLWGTLIGFRQDGAPRLGMLAQPYLGERFAGDGRSAELVARDGRRRLRCRACEGLAAATLSTTDPDLFGGADIGSFRRLREHVRLTRYGYDCYAYAMLASGFIDLVVEAGLKAYDIEPLVPIIEGAGGVVTDWEGRPIRGTPPGVGIRIVAAGDRRLHEAALACLSA